MEICGHCHNVLPKTVDRCTVCGTARVDPHATDVRRRDDGDLPAHAPGWAAPSVPETGIHADDFLRELTGEAGPVEAAAEPTAKPILPPRPSSPTPSPGALAGYLGKSIERKASDEAPQPGDFVAPPTYEVAGDGVADGGTDAAASLHPASLATHLSTAKKVAPDGVAARTTRLDGTVKLGPTKGHRLLSIGAPLLAGALLVAGISASLNIRASEADEAAAERTTQEALDANAVVESGSSVVRLELDGCGIIDQTTGFLFDADQTVLVPRSEIKTDSRPTIVLADGSIHAAEVVGWSLTRDLAVVRADERLDGGVRWGVSARVQVDDAVSVLAIAGPGVATPVAALVTETRTLDDRNTSFVLDTSAATGSIVLSDNGFVIGVVDDRGLVQASDDVAPAVSRIVLDNERPGSECPAPPTTVPPADDNDDLDENPSE